MANHYAQDVLLSRLHKIKVSCIKDNCLRLWGSVSDELLDKIVRAYWRDYGITNYRNWPVDDVDLIKTYGS